MQNIKNWLTLLLLALCTAGCAGLHKEVIVMTSTCLGMEIAENPATQLYHAKLGYARAEIAMIPTDVTNKYTPDVLVELKMTGLFSFNAGIYQRLAVGPSGVSQVGAAALFSKDANGVLNTNAVEALKAAKTTAPPAPPALPPLLLLPR